MSEVTTSVTINASIEAVWSELSDLERHVEWMADAVALDFHSEQRRGVGTAFSCRTKVGPLKTTDEMTVTGWEEQRSIEVAHRGAFEGRGEFRLESVGASQTTVTWTEALRFPLWMAGPLGAAVARPILRHIWAKNLERLRQRVEGSSSS